MSQLENAHRRLLEIFEGNDAGVALVLKASSVNRLDIIAWILDTYADEIDPRQEFTALYVSDQEDTIHLVRQRVRVARIERTGIEPDDLAILDPHKLVNELADFTYVSEEVLRELQGSFDKNMLDIVILDERRVGHLTDYAAFINRVEPGLTVYITKQDLGDHSPWRRLGNMLVVGQPGSPARRSRHKKR